MGEVAHYNHDRWPQSWIVQKCDPTPGVLSYEESVRPSTQRSSVSSCWSEFRERLSPFRAQKLSIADILPADKKIIEKEDRWQTVSQLSLKWNIQALVLRLKKQKVKAIEDSFFKKIENIQKARENVDDRACWPKKKRTNYGLPRFPVRWIV